MLLCQIIVAISNGLILLHSKGNRSVMITLSDLRYPIGDGIQNC